MNTLMIRYKFIHQIVNDIYINANITQFPVDILSIIDSFKNIKIVSYSTYAKDLNLTKEEFLECFTSDDGFSVFSKSKINILYSLMILLIIQSKECDGQPLTS